MKKILLLTTVLFAFFSALSAQITQERADEMVRERMQDDTMFCFIRAKNTVQTGITITTSFGEILELDYNCWVYFVYYNNNVAKNCYLIVNESNGNLLEIKVKNDIPNNWVGDDWMVFDDYADWRLVTTEIPSTYYSLEGCQWKRLEGPDTFLYHDTINGISYFKGFYIDYINGVIVDYDDVDYGQMVIINNNEELENYIQKFVAYPAVYERCTDYPKIDFSKYTLLLARGEAGCPSGYEWNLQQLSAQNYVMRVNTFPVSIATVIQPWAIPIIVDKITDDTTIKLIVRVVENPNF